MPEVLNRREIAVLARVYAENDAKRQPSSVSALRTSVSCGEEISPWGVTRALMALVRKGLLELGKGEGNRREVLVTDAGMAWVKGHLDLLRGGNRYHYRVIAGPKLFSGPRGSGFWSWFFNNYNRLRYG